MSRSESSAGNGDGRCAWVGSGRAPRVDGAPVVVFGLSLITAILGCGPMASPPDLGRYDPRLASVPVQHLEPLSPLPMESPLRAKVLHALTRRAERFGPANVDAAGTGWDVQVVTEVGVAAGTFTTGTRLEFIPADGWSGGDPPSTAMECGSTRAVPFAAGVEMGAHIVSATLARDANYGGTQVDLVFDAEGARALAALTHTALHRLLIISLDGECLTAPTVMGEISGSLSISQGQGPDSEAQARALAGRLDALLPVALTLTEVRAP